MWFRPLALSIVIVVTLTGCPPPVVEPPPRSAPEAQCALDTNFDSSGAAVLTPGTASTGILCPAFDRDFFAVDVEADETILQVTVSMTTGLTAASPAYKIVKDDGSLEGVPTPFAAEDATASREAVNYSVSHRLDTAGRYFVIMQDARFVEDGFDIVNPYSLTVALLPDPDLNEPNNRDDVATPQIVGTFSGQIATTGDEDWYVVDVPAGAQIVDVTVSASADSGVAHVASIFGADGLTELLAAPLVSSLVAGTVDVRLRARADGSQQAFIVVRDATGDLSQIDPALGTYTVVLNLVSNPDLNEGVLGNDDMSRATPISSGTQVNADLATIADQDFYRITVPAGTTRQDPKVLIITLEFDGVLDPLIFQPQVLVRGVDPEVGAQQQACGGECAARDCDGTQCKSERLARFVDKQVFSTGYPLRDAESVLVAVNEFGDDGFQEGLGYRLSVEIIDDADPGEDGDDFLIPNLEFAGFSNGEDLRNQYEQSQDRARELATRYPELCDDDGLPTGCLPLVDVPEPIAGLDDPTKKIVVDCAAPGAGPTSVTATGRLSYEGDRDYFSINLPAQAYFALNLSYSATGVGSTPVELAVFVHNSEGQVISNTLEATETTPVQSVPPGERGNCVSARECNDTSICVDGNCWSESDTNPTFGSHTFPGAGGECSFISPFDSPPYILEVVDNGINDFDPNLTYSFTVDILCGCPDACEVGGGLQTRCQGVPDPT